MQIRTWFERLTRTGEGFWYRQAFCFRFPPSNVAVFLALAAVLICFMILGN